MRLKRLHIENYGPFSVPVDLEIDEKVTVLTGQNDVGKTAILKLVNLICNNVKAQEEDVNSYRIQETSQPLETDAEVKCVVTFEVVDNSHTYVKYSGGGSLPKGDELDYTYHIALSRGVISRLFRPQTGTINHEPFEILRLPKAVILAPSDEVRSLIDTNTANSAERDLLKLAFGDNVTPKLKRRTAPTIRQQIRQANATIKEKLDKILPSNLGLELIIDTDPIDTELERFILSIRDTHGGDTPVHFRGAGLRKLVTLLASLMLLGNTSDYIILLIDEPENSLHADTQHKFRMLLESLTDNGNIQVIYSTHSPSMINTFARHRLRLLERTRLDGKATSTINNKPYQENFSLIRASLGLTPSDSLLYAPITIIVEGPTEILGISALIPKLVNEKGFEDIEQLMSQCHFIDGIGDNLEYWCRLAKSQGSKPILYVDGDKIKKVRQLQKEEKLEGIPVIMLDNSKEFEELVTPEVYFQALSQEIGQEVEYSEYQKWLNDPSLPDRVTKAMFSKKVDAWLLFTHGFELEKPVVMKKAIEISNIEDIDLKSIRELVQQIRILSRA